MKKGNGVLTYHQLEVINQQLRKELADVKSEQDTYKRELQKIQKN